MSAVAVSVSLGSGPRVAQRWAAGHQCLQQRVDRSAWLWADRRRRAASRPAAGLFGGLFSGSGSGSEEGAAAQGPADGGLEEEDGSKMVQLDASSSGSLDGGSEAPFGPLALLAVGFTQLEFQRLQRLLHEEMEAEMVKVVPASAAAMAGSLGAALEAEPVPQFEQAPLGTRRTLFLSGMYAAEVMETIAAYREAGLPEAVFAAAVPNSYERPLQELVQEVFADHQAMKRQRQQAAAAAAQQEQQL